MTNHTTHIISNLPAQHKSFLVRRATSQVIGYRMGNKIMFGDNPNHLDAREYLDEDSAMEALRHIAHIDQSQRMGKVCKDCGYPQTESVSCSKTNDGAHRTEMRNVPVVEVVDGEVRVVRPN